MTPTGHVAIGREASADRCRTRFANGRKVVSGGIHRDRAQAGGLGLVHEWGHGGATRRGGAHPSFDADHLVVTVRKEEARR